LREVVVFWIFVKSFSVPYTDTTLTIKDPNFGSKKIILELCDLTSKKMSNKQPNTVEMSNVPVKAKEYGLPVQVRIVFDDTSIHNVSEYVNKSRLTIDSDLLKKVAEDLRKDTKDTATDSGPLVFHNIFKLGNELKEKLNHLLETGASEIQIQTEITEYYENSFFSQFETFMKLPISLKEKRRFINAKAIKDGKTVLHHAFYHSCWGIVDLLLENRRTLSIQLNIQDSFGRTPLNTCPKLFFSKPSALHRKCYLKRFREMVKSGANLFLSDYSNQLPWNIIQNYGFDETDFFGKCCEDDFTWFQCFYLLKDPLRGLHQFLQGKTDIRSSIFHEDDSDDEFFDALESSRRSRHLPPEAQRDACFQEYHISLHDIFEDLLRGNEEKKLPSNQRDILKYLIYIFHHVRKASVYHLAQSCELKDFCMSALLPMMKNLFLCESMEEPLNVQFLLHRYMFTFNKKEYLSVDRNLYEYESSKDGTAKDFNDGTIIDKINAEVYKHEPLLLIQYRAFSRGLLLDYCLKEEIKPIFNQIQVSNFVDDMYWKSLRYECRRQKRFYDEIFQKKFSTVKILMKEDKLKKKDLAEFQDLLKETRFQIRPHNYTYYSINQFFNSIERKYATEIESLKSTGKIKGKNDSGGYIDDEEEEQRGNMTLDYFLYSMNLRFAPWFPFTIRVITKMILVYLIVKVALFTYSLNYDSQFYTSRHMQAWTGAEVALMMLTAAEVLYEVGILIDLKGSLSVYFHKRKGLVFHLIAIALLVGWAFCRICVSGINVSRVLLSIDVIPQTFTLLQFLSLYKPMGEFIYLFGKLHKDISVFGLFYCIIIIGFGITLFCMFHSKSSFPTISLMFLTLFEYALGQVEFNIFDSNSVPVNTAGVIILVVFLIILPLVVVNLFIARLTYIYDKVHKKAIEEWSFAKTQFVSNAAQLHEIHPFCMLPPPLNVFTSFACVVHYPWYWWRPKVETNDNQRTTYSDYPISLAGSLANILLAIPAAFIRIYPFCVYIYRRILQRSWSDESSYDDEPEEEEDNNNKNINNNNNNDNNDNNNDKKKENYCMYFYRCIFGHYGLSFVFWCIKFPLLIGLIIIKFFASLFIVPIWNYDEWTEEIVDSKDQIFLFVDLFSKNEKEGKKRLSKKPVLSRSFSSSSHFKESLKHAIEDGLDPVDNSSSPKTIESSPGSTTVNSPVHPVPVVEKKKNSIVTNVHKNKMRKVILQLDCYPESYHKLFNEQDIKNILEPLKSYLSAHYPQTSTDVPVRAKLSDCKD
jgi:hypothetical protein